MSSEKDLSTRFAIQAKDLAEALNAALGTIRLRPHGYRPELTRPEEPSTQGGKWALQHLRLVPMVEGKRTIVVGHANRADRKAELRSYDGVDAMHKKQFDAPVELDRKDYEEFLTLAGNLLQVLGMDTEVAGEPRRSFRPSSMPPAPRRSGVVVGFVLGLIVAVVAAVAYGFLRSR
jgi:hypothetical protein